MQRTGTPAATRRRSNGRPIVPVAPVSSNIDSRLLTGLETSPYNRAFPPVRTPE